MTYTNAQLDRIDSLVAEKVMGWHLINREAMGWGPGPIVYGTGDLVSPYRQHQFRPTRSIADAWEAVEKMVDRDPIVRRDGRLWMVIMDASDRADDTETKWHDHRTYTVARRRVDEHDESACLAICVCALRAIGIDVDKEIARGPEVKA